MAHEETIMEARAAFCEPPDPTWGVVVVHGVGATAPGATLGALVPAIVNARAGALEESEPPQNRLLAEEPGSERFPMHLRRFRITGALAGEPRHAAFAEVYWADLAAAGEGRLELVKRLFRLIFDLRHIPAIATLYPGSVFMRVLGFLLHSASWLLIGPVAGATLFMACLLVAHFGAVRVAGVVASLFAWNIGAGAGELGVVLLGLAAAIFSWIRSRRGRSDRDETWSLVIAWLGIAGAVSALVGLVRATTASVTWPFDRDLGKDVASRLFVTSQDAFSGFAGHLLVLFAMIYGTFVLIAFVMTFAAGCWVVEKSVASRRGERQAGPVLDAALATTLLQIELFVVVTAALGLLVLHQFFERPPGEDAGLFTMMVTAFTLKLVFAAIIALCALGVWCWRRLLVRRMPPREPPRLLLHPSIVYTLIVLTMFALVMFAYAVCWEDPRFHQSLEASSAAVVVLTVPVIGLIGAFFRKGLGSALHVVADVTNHFFRPHSPCPWPWKRSEPPGAETFTRQRRCQARFRSVVEELLRAGGVSHLTIVAHSQGSVTALEVLGSDWAARRLSGRVVHLFTLGSPFTSLYQHYFPHRYPRLFDAAGRCAGRGTLLKRAVRSWTNIYRVDDFIGTRIVGDEAGGFPSNRCLAPGGHTGYWQQREVVEILLPFLPCSATRVAQAIRPIVSSRESWTDRGDTPDLPSHSSGRHPGPS
jgi:hypothetical protein